MTHQRAGLVASVGLIALFCAAARASAQVSPSLGTAGTYSVLAGSQVTNIGNTTINGDVGISPGIGPFPHFTGFGTVVFTGGGMVHDADVQAGLAQGDKNAAYTALDQGCTTTFIGAFKELAGVTLVPGVYCATSFHLTNGVLTLAGAATDTWIFKSASDLILTGGAADRVLTPSCNVWWRVVSTATFDAGSSLVGNILADTSITLAANASLSGRALARTAAVTLSSNAISACVATSAPTPTPPPPAPPPPRPNGCAATAPELFLNKTHVNPFVTGANATYSIGLGNNGTTPFGMITVTDTLPATVAFVSATGPSWTCAASGQVVICNTTASVPGAITIVVKPGVDAVPSVTNNAVVAGGGDCDLTNNTTSDVAAVTLGVPTPVPPVPVPTLSEWAFITLAALLAAAGVVALRRRTF